MNYDDPFSRDPVIRLRQIKKAMAELLEPGYIRQAGVDEKGRPLMGPDPIDPTSFSSRPPHLPPP